MLLSCTPENPLIASFIGELFNSLAATPYELVPVILPRLTDHSRPTAVPALFRAAGQKVIFRLVEFLSANKALVCLRPSDYSLRGMVRSPRRIPLKHVTLLHIAAYDEELGHDLAKPSVT